MAYFLIAHMLKPVLRLALLKIMKTHSVGGLGSWGHALPQKDCMMLVIFLFLTSHQEISFLKHVLPLMWAASPSP